MTKIEFLEHLEKRLQVLNKKERDDILGEYAQHIELKMENGLSEEEAIRDFGDLEELEIEILDAYNVNPDYRKIGFNIDKIKVKENIKKAGSYITDIKKRFILWVKNIVNKVKRHKTPASENIEKEKRKSGILLSFRELGERMHDLKIERRQEAKTFGDFISSILHLIKYCAVFAFKAAIIICLIPIILFLMVQLVVLGIMVILLILGYPLFGVSIISLGVLISGFAVVLLVYDIFFSRKERVIK